MEEITLKLTRDEIEELLHATITSYMEYDERLYADKDLQKSYNESVYNFNNAIDELRIKLKKALKDGKEI